MNSGNVCYYSVQKLLSSHLLSKDLKIRIHKTIILPMVLYGRETWSLTLSEEHKLRVLLNMVLKRIFGPKRVEVSGVWRKLHNDQLHNLYSSPSIIRMKKSRRMRWAGHVAHMVGNPERKRPLGRPRHGWVYNIKMDLREIKRGGMN
jgi:hypothetical protein